MARGSTAIPEKIHSYKAYNEGEKLVGVQAEAELGSLEAITSTVSGPGIAGEIEAPNVGHFGSIKVPISFRTVSREAGKLMAPGPHLLTFRADQTSYDSAAGQHRHRQLRVTVRGFNTSTDLGKLQAATPTDTKVTLEVFYIKIIEDGHTLLELDKYNEVYIVDGVDYMAEILANT